MKNKKLKEVAKFLDKECFCAMSQHKTCDRCEITSKKNIYCDANDIYNWIIKIIKEDKNALD